MPNGWHISAVHVVFVSLFACRTACALLALAVAPRRDAQDCRSHVGLD